MKFHKPKVIISKCLEFDACRYDGQLINNKYIIALKEFIDFIPVCPEVEIGLGIPRDPIKIIDNNGNIALYQDSTGRDYAKKMNTFSNQFINSLENVDGFILGFDKRSKDLEGFEIFDRIWYNLFFIGFHRITLGSFSDPGR